MNTAHAAMYLRYRYAKLHNAMLMVSIAASFFIWAFLGQTIAKLIVCILLTTLLAVLLYQNNFTIRPFSQIEPPGIWVLCAFALISFLGVTSSYIVFHDFSYSLMGFVINFPVLLVAITILTGKKANEGAYKIVVVIAVASAILTIMQSIDYKSIPAVNSYVQLMTETHEDTPLAASLVGESGIRAFGLFQNALTNGLFISIAVTVTLSQFFYKIKPIKSIFIIALLTYAVVLTDTRNCYLAVAVSVIACALLKIRVIMNYAKVNPYLINTLLLGIVFLSMLLIIGYFVITGEIFKENGKIDSIAARVITWGQVFSLYMKDADLVNVVFGFGIVQWANAPHATELWAMDNLFVQLYMYSGLVGVVAFTCVWIVTSVHLLRRAANSNLSALISYVIAVQFLLAGIFNSTFSIFPYTSTAWMLILLGLAKDPFQGEF